MYFVSITRLRLRSIIYLPQFLLANEASIKSIKRIEGFICGKELIDKKLTFWTVTIWRSGVAMKYFRNNDPHKTAMRKLPLWCDEAAYVHWEQDDATIPGWDVVYKRLLADGKMTKVKFPSPQQEGMNYAPTKWSKSARNFKFKGK
jgi:hypothetical protein